MNSCPFMVLCPPWRDIEFGAEATSSQVAILIVAAVTGASGLLVVATSWKSRPALQPNPRLAIRE
jgi:hypothetical protein